MCNTIKCALQYTVDLINNNINRDVQEECANRLYWVYTPGIGCILIGKLVTYCVAGKHISDLGTDRKENTLGCCLKNIHPLVQSHYTKAQQVLGKLYFRWLYVASESSD